MVTLARRAQRIPFAPVVAVLFGVVAAILMAAVPGWLFERAVVASGLPNLVQAAAPPLGLVARLLAIATAFVGGALLVRILLIPLSHAIEGKSRARTPWRDAGYDADGEQSAVNPLPPRRPIFAPDELGAPLMSDEAIAAVQPVAGSPVSELDVFADVDNALDLAAPVQIEELEPVIVAPAATDSSIAALIRRLEDGIARRASNDSDPDGSGNGVMPLSRSWIVPENVDGVPRPIGAQPLNDDESALRQSLAGLRRMVSR